MYTLDLPQVVVYTPPPVELPTPWQKIQYWAVLRGNSGDAPGIYRRWGAGWRPGTFAAQDAVVFMEGCVAIFEGFASTVKAQLYADTAGMELRVRP